MPSLCSKLRFAWEYLIQGKHKLPQVSPPPDFDYQVPDDCLMNFLLGMYCEHGASAVRVVN